MSKETKIKEDTVTVPVAQGDLDATSNAEFYNPHGVLGGHLGIGKHADTATIRVLRPLAKSVTILTQDGEYPMTHEYNGVFVVTVPASGTKKQPTIPDYRVRTEWESGAVLIEDDPYRYMPTVGDMDTYLFGEGRHEKLWETLGAHVLRYDDPMGGADGTPGEQVVGTAFSVWAPNAHAVRVVGNFNAWDGRRHAMRELGSSGVWEIFIPGIGAGETYKFQILNANYTWEMKADPMERQHEVPPSTASIVTESTYKWNDDAWMQHRRTTNPHDGPVSIYEVHAGSWKQGLTYRDLAKQLVDYVKQEGFTHVEFMPLAQHPFSGSWGYQVTGYYAVDSRLGSPDDFRYLVDQFHQAGIGVIMDWVPGGFCADSHGLATFNGHMLFEHEIHPNWGTHKFDFARGEVRSFLVSNVLYWLENFHVDGIRMDGVSSMLYLNFGIDDPGQKKFNKYGTEEDLDASAFIRQVNCAVEAHYPDVMMMAEESTAWPLVTYPPQDGGLGFHYKWDMGWMNDTLHYMQTDFPWRPGNHGLLTFSIMYAFTENFICPLSHDEVVHGKCSLIGRMPGDWWRQFAGLRTLAFYQMTHPGAKLNFMGNEIGQFIEWRYYESIQWFLTEEYETHKHHQAFIKALNHLYTAEPALYERGYTDDGFTWIDADNSKQSIVSFVRQGEDIDNDLVILINFDPASYESFRVGVPREGDWEVIFDSDRPEFGGSGYAGEEPYTCSSEPYPWNGQMDSIEIKVPGLAGVVLKRRGPSSYKPPVVEAPKKATRKRASSVKPKPAAAKKAPAKAKATKPAAKAKTAAKSAAKATATKKPAAKKATAKAKSASVKSPAKDA